MTSPYAADEQAGRWSRGAPAYRRRKGI